MRFLTALTVGATLALTVTGLVLIFATPPAQVPVGLRREQIVGYLVLQASLVSIGGLLTWRRPRNAVGWLLSAAGLVSGGQFFFAGYAVFGLFASSLPGAAIAAWLYSWTGVGMGVAMGWLAGLFPDGRVRSRWARIALVLLTAGSAALMIALALRPGPLAELPMVQNPLAWTDGAAVLTAALVLGLVALVAAIGLMFRHIIERSRAAVGIERQQLKWLVWSVVILLATMLFAMPWIFGPPDPAGADASIRFVARLAAAFAMSTVPVGIAFAILRYRLYDIDVLINRTLVYAAVSAVLVGAYVASVILFQAILRPLTGGSDLSVAASTLFVVALFQPVRRRMQEAVDRRFYRSRYDAARTLDAFSARLRSEVELESVQADLIGVVADTVSPTHASLWLR